MSSLTDRYLAATLRAVPAPRREEIATELRASIDDMIDDRTADGQEPLTAERDVLTELGNPDRLAARYSDRRLQLIGPAYYLVWQRLLKLLLLFVPATVGTIVAVIDAADGRAAGAIGSGISTAIQVAVQTAFWVTLVFAVLERVSPAVDLPDWTVDQLPDAPTHRDIPLADTIASAAMVLLAIAYLPWQHFQSWIEDDAGRNIPIIDPALWSSWLPVLIAVLVASLVFEIVKYRAGRWTWRLFVAKALLNLAFAIPVMWLASADRLLNPDLTGQLTWLQDADHRQSVGAIIVVGVAVIVVWDLIDTAIKTRRPTG